MVKKKGGILLPFLYLSPSTQQFNPYATSGNEEYWMNLLADEMEPYLRANGINFTRNDPATSAAAAIRESNAGNYDFHLALHSNAAAGASSGNIRGIDAYYYPTSQDGLRMANIIVDNLRQIYPLPERVRAVSTTAIGEVRRTQAPSVLLELGYHDNVQDATWVEENLTATARQLVLSLTEYFGLPFIEPSGVRTGTVRVSAGGLNQRAYPTTNSQIYQVIPNGSQVRIYGSYDGWYSIAYADVYGFVRQEYVQ